MVEDTFKFVTKNPYDPKKKKGVEQSRREATEARAEDTNEDEEDKSVEEDKKFPLTDKSRTVRMHEDWRP